MEHERATQPGRAQLSHVVGDGDLSREARFHVTGTAPIHEAIPDLGAEGIRGPERFVVDRDGVHMAVEYDCRPSRRVTQNSSN
jgi:hypothetical protein